MGPGPVDPPISALVHKLISMILMKHYWKQYMLSQIKSVCVINWLEATDVPTRNMDLLSLQARKEFLLITLY